MQRSMESCQLKAETEVAAAAAADSEGSDDFQDAQEDLSPRRRLDRQFSPEKEASEAERDSIVQSESWKRQRKHVFVLSEAGKPIFSIHGEEDDLASIMAVMQAMVSYVIDMGDVLKSFNAGPDRQIVFLNKGPLILVAVSRGTESVSQLIVQLTYVYNQILSLLTLTQLTKIFEQKKGFDLRRMLAGSERLIYSLTRAMDSDPAYMLSSVRVLPLNPATRDSIAKTIIAECSKVKNVVFGILLAENQLVTLVRMKKYYIHPADLHLIFNIVNSSESFKDSEAWMPICLPKFDSRSVSQFNLKNDRGETHRSISVFTF